MSRWQHAPQRVGLSKGRGEQEGSIAVRSSRLLREQERRCLAESEEKILKTGSAGQRAQGAHLWVCIRLGHQSIRSPVLPKPIFLLQLFEPSSLTKQLPDLTSPYLRVGMGGQWTWMFLPLGKHSIAPTYLSKLANGFAPQLTRFRQTSVSCQEVYDYPWGQLRTSSL